MTHIFFLQGFFMFGYVKIQRVGLLQLHKGEKHDDKGKNKIHGNIICE
jgi:hypothetical protein